MNAELRNDIEGAKDFIERFLLNLCSHFPARKRCFCNSQVAGKIIFGQRVFRPNRNDILGLKQTGNRPHSCVQFIDRCVFQNRISTRFTEVHFCFVECDSIRLAVVFERIRKRDFRSNHVSATAFHTFFGKWWHHFLSSFTGLSRGER